MKQHYCKLPAFNVELYVALAIGDRFSAGLNDQLNFNMGASLTVCPECMIDDFTHVEGCTIGNRIDEAEVDLKIALQEV